jgi:transcriptional regulator with XRE-family HTH domain
VTVGERIRQIRLAKKMTPAALARAAGMTRGAIHQLEEGLSRSPSFENGLSIALALNVSPYELAFGKRKPGPELTIADDVAELRGRVVAIEGRLDAKSVRRTR